jgi:DNA-binding PadR family transcriptional regulator
MATELSLFSIEILGLVGRQGAGPHDLLRFAQRGRMLAWAGESQYYTEPKRLAKLGYLEARKEPGKTRERTVYTLTDEGVRALREYAQRPVTFTPLKSDALLRMLICDLAGEDVTRESMTALRDDLTDIAVRLDQAEEAAHGLPHREKYLLIATRFLRRYLELHEQLVDEVESELGAARKPGPATRSAPSASPAPARR